VSPSSRLQPLALDEALVLPLLSAMRGDTWLLVPAAPYYGRTLTDCTLQVASRFAVLEPYRLATVKGSTQGIIGYDMDRLKTGFELRRPAARNSSFSIERPAAAMPLKFSRIHLVVRFTPQEKVAIGELSEDDARALVASPTFEANAADFIHGKKLPPSSYVTGLRHALGRTYGDGAVRDGLFWRVPVFVRGRWRPPEMDTLRHHGWRIGCAFDSQFLFLHHDGSGFSVGMFGAYAQPIMRALLAMTTGHVVGSMREALTAYRWKIEFADPGYTGGGVYARCDGERLVLELPTERCDLSGTEDLLRRLRSALSTPASEKDSDDE
jgi:hypothetical protein